MSLRGFFLFIVGVLGAMACYQPTVPEGLPCSETGQCPAGQSCSAEGQCFSAPPASVDGAPDPGDDGSVPSGPDAMLAPRCDPQVTDRNHVYGPDPYPGDRITNITLTDDWIALGVPQHDGSSTNPDYGYFYAFLRNGVTWNVNDARNHDSLTGASNNERTVNDLMISGAIMVMGNENDQQRGSAHVWTLDKEVWGDDVVVPGEGQTGAQFGHRVAVSGNTFATTEPGSNLVHMFEGAGQQWTSAGSFTVPGLLDGDLAMTDQFVVAGAPSDGGTGAVHVFRRDGATWVSEGVLRPDVAGAMGHSVAVRGNFIAAGAPSEDTEAPDAGAVYMFQRIGGAWVRQDTIKPPVPAMGQRFGSAVALTQNDTALIGAEGQGPANPQGRHDGAAYVFVFNGAQWSPAMELACTGSSFGRCGSSIAATDSRFAIAAATADTSGEDPYVPRDGLVRDAGMIYTFELSCGP